MIVREIAKAVGTQIKFFKKFKNISRFQIIISKKKRKMYNKIQQNKPKKDKHRPLKRFIGFCC